MQIIQKIRDKGAAIVIAVIALSLIGFILMDANLGLSRNAGADRAFLGKVNGKKIDAASFDTKVKLIEEQYIKLKEVMCPHEGLNIRFEYRVGDINCGNARHITLESLIGYRVDAMIGYVCPSMWSEIEKYIESLKKDKS